MVVIRARMSYLLGINSSLWRFTLAKLLLFILNTSIVRDFHLLSIFYQICELSEVLPLIIWSWKKYLVGISSHQLSARDVPHLFVALDPFIVNSSVIHWKMTNRGVPSLFTFASNNIKTANDFIYYIFRVINHSIAPFFSSWGSSGHHERHIAKPSVTNTMNGHFTLASSPTPRPGDPRHLTRGAAVPYP